MSVDMPTIPLRTGSERAHAAPTPRAALHRRLTWIPSGDRWLSARVDEPDDRIARGACIVVPSFDREALVSFRTTRALAAQARTAGFLAYTFSWSGDGDSSALGDHDDPAQVWVEDLAAVVSHARDLLGPAAPVHFVGLRLGAAVLARLGDTGPGSRVYWEPLSGSALLRSHALIRRTVVPVPVQSSGIELDGTILTPAQAEGLRRLRAPSPDELGPRETVRKELDPRIAARLALGAPYFAEVPLAAIREIVADLPLGAAGEIIEWSPLTTATMRIHRDGAPVTVTETMCEIGPKQLPAIRSESPDVDGRAAILFTAMGAEVKAGPGSLWARASRELGAEGAVCLRADRGGLGDDADPDRAPEPRPYTRAAVEDVATAVAALSGSGLPIIGVGVCAGAWAMLRAVGPGYEAPLREILGVNVVHWHPDPAVYTEAFYARYHGPETGQRRSPSQDAEKATQQTRRGGWYEAWHPLEDRILSAREAVLTELSVRFPRLRSVLRHDVPLDLAEPMLRQVPRRVGLTLLYGVQDHRIFVGKGGRRALRRARGRGQRLVVAVSHEVDHNLFAQRAQRETIALLRRIIAVAGGLVDEADEFAGLGGRPS